MAGLEGACSTWDLLISPSDPSLHWSLMLFCPSTSWLGMESLGRGRKLPSELGAAWTWGLAFPQWPQKCGIHLANRALDVFSGESRINYKLAELVSLHLKGTVGHGRVVVRASAMGEIRYHPQALDNEKLLTSQVGFEPLQWAPDPCSDQASRAFLPFGSLASDFRGHI